MIFLYFLKFMKTKVISSLSNPIIKQILNFKKNNLFLLSSQNIIKEAIKNKFKIDTLIVLDSKIDLVDNAIKNSSEQILIVNEQIINKINTNKKFNYVFALVKKPPKTTSIQFNNNDKNIVLLENVQNPENVGMIIRTMLGLGYQKILLFNCANINNEKLISSSSGYVFNGNVIEINNLDFVSKLKSLNYEVIITNLDNSSQDLIKIKNELIDKKKIIIFGNEGKGVSNYLKQLSTISIKFNMENDVDSFNVAISSSIIGLLLIKKI